MYISIIGLAASGPHGPRPGGDGTIAPVSAPPRPAVYALPLFGWRTIALSAGLAAALLAYGLAIWFDWLPWLRGYKTYPDGWSWRYLSDFPPASRFIAPLVLLAAGWAVVRFMERRAERAGRWPVVLGLGALVLLGWAFELTLLHLKYGRGHQLLTSRVLDSEFTGYFGAALGVSSLDAFVSDWRTILAACNHCKNHPPGTTLFYWAIIQAVTSLPASIQEWLAQVVPPLFGLRGRTGLPQIYVAAAFAAGHTILLLAAMIVIPAYGVARNLAGAKHAPALAALVLTIPGLMLMAPELDQVYAALASLALLLTLWSLQSVAVGLRVAWSAAAGLVMATGLYFTMGLVVWIALLLCLSLADLFGMLLGPTSALPLPWGERSGRWVGWAVGFSGGIIGPFLLLNVLFGFNMLDVLAQTREYYETAGRWMVPISSIWFFYGPLDVGQFLGVPLGLASLGSLWLGKRPSAVGWLSPRIDGWFGGLNPYGIGLWGVVVVAFGGQVVMSEGGRQLLFVMPLAVYSLALAIGVRGLAATGPLYGLLGAQVLVCLAIGSRWLTP